MIIQKVYNFFGGLFKRDDNKDLVGDNQVVDIKNFDITDTGFLQKRLGRSREVLLNGTDYRSTGLIQNETQGGTRQEYCVANTDIYYNNSGTAESKFSGLTAGNFHAEYWQNQCFWGNGSNDIVNLKQIPGDIYNNLYISHVGGISLVSRTDKSSGAIYRYKYPNSGDTTTGIAVDSTYIYLLSATNMEVLNKSTLALVSTEAITGTAIAVDSDTIYVISDTNEVKRYSKSDYSLDGTDTVVASINSIAVDSAHYFTWDSGNEYLKKYVKGTGNADGQIDMSTNGLGAVNCFTVNETLAYMGQNVLGKITAVTKATGNNDSTYGDGIGDTQGKFTAGDLIGVAVDDTYLWAINQDAYSDGNFYATYFNNSGGDLTGRGRVSLYKGPGGADHIAVDPYVTNASDDANLDDFFGYLGSPLTPYTAVAKAGSLTGDYTYKVTFTDGTYETTASPATVSLTLSSQDALVLLKDVNIGDDITHWIIYRSKAGADYEKVASVAIATREYVDSNSDASISGNEVPPDNSTLYDFLDSAVFTFHQDKMWIADGKKIYFSDPFKPYYFPSENWIQLDTKDDIIGLHTLGGGLMCFSANQIWAVEGITAETYTVRNISDNVGTISHRSIQEWNNVLIWLDSDGIWVSDGTPPQKISEPNVQDVIDSIQADKWGYICGAVYQDKYYISLPTTSGNAYNDVILIYDFIYKNWTKYEDWDIHSFAVVEDSNGDPELWGADNTSGVYRLLNTNDDDDNAGDPVDISCSVESKHYDFAEPTFKKKVQRITAVTGNDGTNDVTATIKWKVGENAEESEDFTIDKVKEISYIRPEGGTGNKYYVKVEESGVRQFQVYGFEADVQAIKRRRLDS